MSADLIARHAAPVPRYTSYPTAAQFGPAVDADRYDRWLPAVPAAASLSLYLHVPFCDTLCWFCGCHTRVVNRHGPVARYLTALLAELELVADRLAGDHRVTHLHLGGGSPTMLSPAELARLGARLRDRFAVADDAEIGVEIDPRGLSEDTVAALAAFGVNRASIGVQDFDPRVQGAINRLQGFAETERVVRLLRAHGIERLNVDLIYGLPHQTEAGVEATARAVLDLAPDRIALFGYAHVPWMKPHQKLIDEAALPGARARFRQARRAAEVFEAAWLEPIGLDHFARPDDPLAQAAHAGRLRRNFQGYTTDAAEALIGLGASAIGALPDGYVQNTADVATYLKTVADGRLATARGVALDADDRLRRNVIERLMCDLRVDLDAVAARHGVAAARFDAELRALAALRADGLVATDGRVVSVTEAGRPFLRVVAAAFDRYLGGGRHSIAV
jgi:oxygen-independent coproporphyrinogen-3 oxidase